MACPALPLCGLAQTEAERVMPDINERLRNVLRSLGMAEDQSFVTRVTGCPNGCARPYLAELALVGQGPNQYQIWVAGSPVGTRVGQVLMDKMKIDDLESTVEPLFAAWRDHRSTENEVRAQRQPTPVRVRGPVTGLSFPTPRRPSETSPTAWASCSSATSPTPTMSSSPRDDAQLDGPFRAIAHHTRSARPRHTATPASGPNLRHGVRGAASP